MDTVPSKLDANMALMQGANAMAASKDTVIPDAPTVSCAGKEEWR